MADDDTTDDDVTDDDDTTTDTGADAAAQAAADAAKWKALSRKNETAAKKAQAEIDRLKAEGQSDSEKAVEKAKAEGIAEATKTANARILKAEVRAAAAGKLSDPDLAVRLLDLDEFAVGDDGEVDTKALGKAIDGLLKQYPGLAGAASSNGSADGGARGGAGKAVDMNAWLRGEKAAL